MIVDALSMNGNVTGQGWGTSSKTSSKSLGTKGKWVNLSTWFSDMMDIILFALNSCSPCALCCPPGFSILHHSSSMLLQACNLSLLSQPRRNDRTISISSRPLQATWQCALGPPCCVLGCLSQGRADVVRKPGVRQVGTAWCRASQQCLRAMKTPQKDSGHDTTGGCSEQDWTWWEKIFKFFSVA